MSAPFSRAFGHRQTTVYSGLRSRRCYAIKWNFVVSGCATAEASDVGSIPITRSRNLVCLYQLSDWSRRQKAALKNKTSFERGTARSCEKPETQFRTSL